MYNNQNYINNIDFSKNNSELNYNKCNYIQKTNPSSLYSAYNGFIRGNMFPDLYNQYKINKPYDIEPMNEQAQILTYVDAYSFGCLDINLYLDTHPNDQAMIGLYSEYLNELGKVQQKYESMYGVLEVDSLINPKYPWEWNNSPWPWEN